jgi:hypothetical protein
VDFEREMPMAHVTEFTGKNFQSLIRRDIAPGAIFHTLGNRPREKAVKIVKTLGIHEDYIDDALKGRPYGAKVIDLDEYRWMRNFDEL